jgi:hypothetical protein
LYVHSNKLTAIDLSPLKNCLDLKGLFLANNNIKIIDLTPITPNINRIQIDEFKAFEFEDDNIISKIDSSFIPENVYYTESVIENDNSDVEYDEFDEEFSDFSGRTPNDDHSDSLNPNNPSFQSSMDNRSNQMNPNNSAYHSSRRR